MKKIKNNLNSLKLSNQKPEHDQINSIVNFLNQGKFQESIENAWHFLGKSIKVRRHAWEILDFSAKHKQSSDSHGKTFETYTRTVECVEVCGYPWESRRKSVHDLEHYWNPSETLETLRKYQKIRTRCCKIIRISKISYKIFELVWKS